MDIRPGYTTVRAVTKIARPWKSSINSETKNRIPATIVPGFTSIALAKSWIGGNLLPRLSRIAVFSLIIFFAYSIWFKTN